MIQLGISAFYHDAAACIVKDGKLLAAIEEERFTGVKHDSRFPLNSIKWLLKTTGLRISDVDIVEWYEIPIHKKARVKAMFRRWWFRSLPSRFRFLVNHQSEKKIHNILKYRLGYNGDINFHNHHDSHAAFSWWSSGYDSANVITIDGVGEAETVAVYRADKDGLDKLKSVMWPNSLGMFYSTFTAFLGFQPNEGEYKVMGLAPYGDSDKYFDKLVKLIQFRPGIEFTIDQTYFTWEWSDRIMFKDSLCEYLNVPPRLPEEPIQQYHKDIAAAVQRVYEKVFKHIIAGSRLLNVDDNLCLGGGCAYNGVANSKAYEYFKSVWVPYAPSDSGSAIGACLLNNRAPRPGSFKNPYLGPKYSPDSIEELLQERGLKYVKLTDNLLVSKVAREIHNNEAIIGWFRGRMEFGARALGNRSILASPLPANMKKRLNSVIKKREGFRPFAPSCLEDRVAEFFQVKEPVPYMNQVVKVRDEHADILKAVTHVDGSARVQTVTRKSNLLYYALLTRLGTLSGYPICLNTSFNFKDQTITMTPLQAIDRFLDCEMDALVINNFYITKDNI
jgi:carbamoyltransferase